jgi:hypothetical protein
MKRVAIFISGRLTCYENHLIRNLEKLQNHLLVDLFISINGERDDYHKEAEQKLQKWLRVIQYEKYIPPSETIMIPNNHRETLFQIIDSIKTPYTNLSCFYNDTKCYSMITQYANEKNIEYDIYMKFRPDIYFFNINVLENIGINMDENSLYSCIPPQEIYIWGDRRASRCICDAFAYGSKKVMEQYCKTYSFIIKTNNERNGSYRINYEPSLTESFCNYALDLDNDNYQTIINMFASAPFKVHYFTAPYEIDRNRRNRDTFFKECTRGSL